MTARTSILALLLAVTLASGAEGQDGRSVRQWLRPRATLRTGLWSSSRQVDDRGPLAGSALWAELNPELTPWAYVRVAGWGGAGELVGGLDGSLRELYARLRFGPADIRLGKQIIAWGRTDALNPTDNLAPDDLTLLVEDDDDQRIGVPSARVSVYHGRIALTGIWLADFRGHSLPLASPPAGLRLIERLPNDERSQGAVRLEATGGAVDWSVSYFTGFDLTPDVAYRPAGSGGRLILAHHRLHVLGADAATVLGRHGFRTEAAWLITEDRSGRDPEIKNSTLYAVVGADRTFGGYLNVNLQYLVRWVDGFTNPDDVTDPARREAARLLARVTQQLRPVQHGVTLRVSDKWWHESLEAEVSGVVMSPGWQLSLRPRASYAATDRWRIVAGADLVRGDDGTLFHILRKNSSAFLELQYGL